MSQGGHIVKPAGRRRTWAIIYRDPTGAQQWEGKFKKRSEAQARLNEILGAIDKGTYARPSSVTFEKFAEDWLAGRRQIRGSTESGYGFDHQQATRSAARSARGIGSAVRAR